MTLAVIYFLLGCIMAGFWFHGDGEVEGGALLLCVTLWPAILAIIIGDCIGGKFR